MPSTARPATAPTGVGLGALTSKLIKLELTSQLSAEQVGHLFQAVGAKSDVVELESFLAAATAIQTLLGAVMNDATAALVEKNRAAIAAEREKAQIMVGQALLDGGSKPAGGSSAKAAQVLSAGAEAKAEESHEAPLPSARGVIDHRVTEDKIVPRCDAVIKAGADASTAVYDAVHQSVVFTEAEGVKALREELSDQRLTERVGRGSVEAKPTKTSLKGVRADAVTARPLATGIIARAAAACGVEPLRTFTHVGGVTSACFTPDGLHVVTGSYDRTARVWLVRDGSLVRVLEGHTDCVNSVFVTPDGLHVVTGSDDHTVRVWLLADASLVRILEGHTKDVSSVCVTPDGLHVVTGSIDRTARVWLLADGSLVRTLKGHTGWVESVCVTPDGLHVVSASDDRTARVWLLADGSLVRTLQGHTGDVNSVCITPDGLHVVTGSADNTARVWLLSDGSLVRTLECHTDAVISVGVMADGQRLVTGSTDNTACVWLLADGSLVHTLEGHTSPVSSVCVTPDGESVATGSDDMMGRVYLL